MLSIHIEKKELWDDSNNQFVYIGPDEPLDLNLEHSLVSIYKWESKYHKSYLNTDDKTTDEMLDYISMMVTGEHEDKIDKDAFKALSEDDIKRISEYLNDKMTATTFSEDKKEGGGKKTINNEIVTAEILYYYMTALNIPFECQYWHINKLLTLIRVCSIKNSASEDKKNKKMTSSDMALRRAKMEAARAKYKH